MRLGDDFDWLGVGLETILQIRWIRRSVKLTIKADHIFELAGLGLFCYYSFIHRICKIILYIRLISYKFEIVRFYFPSWP